MHEELDESKIEITIPDFYEQSVMFSIEGPNLKTLDEIEEYGEDEGIVVRRKGTENPSDSDKWEINQDNFNFVDMGIRETEEGIDSLGVTRLEVFADSTLTTLNIEITNNYDTYSKDKKEVNTYTAIFYSTLLLTILSLIIL